MKHLLDKGIIHRDIAARNVLLDGNLKVKISDFGLTKRTGRQFSSTVYYKQITRCAMPLYLYAPELLRQRLNQNEVCRFTHKSDVWAFGLLVWEVLTRGVKPFSRCPELDFTKHTEASLKRIEEGERPYMPTVMKENNISCFNKLWHVVYRQALEADPDKREPITKVLGDLSDLLGPFEQVRA